MSQEKWLLEKDDNSKFITKLIIVLFVAFIVFFIYKIINIIILLIIALFLNILFAPILNKFNKWHINDILWIILIYIIIFLFIIIVFYSVIPIFIKQISLLINLVYDYINKIIIIYNSEWIKWLWIPMFIQSIFINIDLNQILNPIKDNIWQISIFISNNLKNFLTNWAWIIFSITNLILNFVLVFIFTFFIALERNNIRIFFYKIIPEKISKYILKQEDKIVNTLFNWLKSQLILWISIFLITYVWLFVIEFFWVNINEKLTLALVAWMMEFIPYIGPFIALLPALAIALWISLKATIIIIILYIIIQQIENNVLVPYVMWKTLSLSPFSVLIAMIIWASLFGIIWIIISVPVIAVIQIFLTPYLEKRKIRN